MKPFVSIIVPTFQREELFFDCLESLADQDYPQNSYEVIAVYDGEECPYNSNRLKSRLKKIKNGYFYCIRHSGAATVRNYAIKKATGELILTIDDDCRAKPNWVSSYVDFMKNNRKLVGAGGTVKSAKPASFVQAYIAFKRLMFKPVRDINGEIITVITANACYCKNALDKINGFDQEFPYSGGEDLDLSMRLRKLGSLGYSSSSIVYHYHRASIKGLIKQHVYYGRGVYLACKKNKFEFEKLKFYKPDLLGFIRYLFYVIARIFTVSMPEFWNKKLPAYNWIPYAILDIIRKLSFSIGTTLEYYNFHDGYSRTTKFNSV